MSPADLASKIAEEVFRTIERESGIVKAEIAEGIERVVSKEMRNMAALIPRNEEAPIRYAEMPRLVGVDSWGGEPGLEPEACEFADLDTGSAATPYTFENLK